MPTMALCLHRSAGTLWCRHPSFVSANHLVPEVLEPFLQELICPDEALMRDYVREVDLICDEGVWDG